MHLSQATRTPAPRMPARRKPAPRMPAPRMPTPRMPATRATVLAAPPPKSEACNCLAVREAARRITQFYDRFLAPLGLRTTQFSILAKLRRLGPITINALAAELVMDRTTLGRNILPLERDGLIAVEQGSRDRRSKALRGTEAAESRFPSGMTGWWQRSGGS